MRHVYAFVEQAVADALAESEERFHALADDAPFAIWVMSPEGRPLYVNRACWEFCGWREQELLDADYGALLHPEDAARFLGDLRAALRERREFASEARVRCASGEYRLVQSHAMPRSAATGEFLGLIGTSSDVTDRREAEEASRGERFRALFEGHMATMLLIDPEDGRIVDANAAAARFYGYAREQLREMRIDQINQLPPEEVAKHRRRALDRTLNEFVFPHLLASGEIRDVEVYSSPVTIQGRRMLFSIIHDVTARRQAEDALRQSREDLDRAQAVGQIGWWRLDMRKNVLTWSDENHRIFGVPKGAPLTYETFLASVHPDDRRYVDERWNAGVRGEPYDIEHRIVVDDKVKWVREKAYLEVDGEGRLLGGFGITQDITARREAEEALRESEAERAAQQERARLARDLHDSVSQAIFAAALKAEALEIAAEGADDGIAPQARQVCRLCKGALADLRAMLLELRGESLQDVPLEQLLRQLAEAAEGRTSARVQLSVHGSGPLPSAVHVAFYRVAQEALNNVAHHARAEHAWVDVEYTGAEGRLEVRDDGCGFEPRDFGPAHLGIRSMRERAEEVDADLEVTSAPGSGTHVVLSWPRPAAAE